MSSWQLPMSTATAHLPTYLVPFITLSYPTDTPTNIDSFHHAQYYNIGPLDACFIITCIAVMAIFRDAVRLGILEPFAKWKLSNDLYKKRGNQGKRNVHVANGGWEGNGHCANGGTSHISKRESRQMHRSVLRFAEQGWSVLYYGIQWTYGLVGFPSFFVCFCPFR